MLKMKKVYYENGRQRKFNNLIGMPLCTYLHCTNYINWSSILCAKNKDRHILSEYTYSIHT